MELQTASRKKAKMGLQGPSGAGKTMSALLIAYGLCGDWNKIAVIDSENHSADLYSHLGSYKVLPMIAPFTPERFVQAIHVCERSEMDVIIIDSISHEWEGNGGVLDIHGSMIGNSYTNWSKVTPRHNDFLQAMLQSSSHVISTIRAKQDYILVDKNGKQVPEKVGLKGITREGIDYEFTLVFEMNIRNQATVSKDRTGLFTGKAEFLPSVETGKSILQWCNIGIDPPPRNQMQEVVLHIASCRSSDQLLKLYYAYPQYQETLLPEFTKRRQELLKFNTNNQNQIKHAAHS